MTRLKIAFYKMLASMAFFAALAGTLAYGGGYVRDTYLEPAREQVLGEALMTLASLSGKEIRETSPIMPLEDIRRNIDPNRPCYIAAYMVAERDGVPVDVLYTIIHQESGGDHAAVGVNKDGSRDVGCMQINQKIWTNAFTEWKREPFIARLNVTQGARILKMHYARAVKQGKEGRAAWVQAMRDYHSRTKDKADIYAARSKKSAETIGAEFLISQQ